MSPEEVILPIVFDPAFYPARPAVAVMDFCLNGFPAGKDMDVPVKKPISSVWKGAQLVFPGNRAVQVTELCMEKRKGFQHDCCLFPEKTVLGGIGERAHASQKPLIRMGACCFQKENSGLIHGGKLFEYIIKCHRSILLLWFLTIIEEIQRYVRSGCVGISTELIRGPVNLHELPGINTQTWNCQVIKQGKGSRQESLLPVIFKLADDVFDVILIDQEIGLHYGTRIRAFFHAVQDLLLIMEWDLGIRDQDGREQGMGNEAFCAKHTLDGKADKNRMKFNRAFVMAVTDETAFLATGAFDHVKLKIIDRTGVKILRKIVAVFKDNCYHMLVRAQRSFTPGAVWGKTGQLWKVGACLFSLVRDNGNIKGSGIKESDGRNVILFDAGALLNLMRVE